MDRPCTARFLRVSQALRGTLVVAAFVAAGARAQTAPAPATDAAPAAAPATASATDAAATPATPAPPAAQSGAVNARLAPGGVLASASGFPLSITATLDNSFGNGFLYTNPYQRQPAWSTSLSLRPSAGLPAFGVFPKTRLISSIDFSVNNWLPASDGAGYFDQSVRVSDLGVGLVFPGLFTEENTHISVTPVISARAPLSITSRQQNLLTNIGASAQVSWSSPDAAYGSFFAQYSPSVRASLYTQDAPSIPCSAQFSTASAVRDPLAQGDLPLQYAVSSAEILPNGECRLIGRQTVASFGNNVAGGWSMGEHFVSLSLGWNFGFLRPLKNAPELSSQFASGQSFTENTSGSVSYTYQLPIGTNTQLTVGVGSGQPAVDASGDVRFPFWDFVTPGNNLSSAFVDLTVGI